MKTYIVIDSNDYARTASYIEVDISESSYFMVTDATFVNEFYYGYRSRLINVYCYDPLASVDYIRSNYKIELIPDSELTIENYDLVIKMVSHQIFENQEFLNNTDYKLSDLL